MDYGTNYDYQIDWVDHIIPASKGGTNKINNGALAGWYPNYLAGNGKKKNYICRRGKILNKAKLKDNEERKISNRIIKFSNLKESDWYLNRALWHLSIAAWSDWENKKGIYKKRDKRYWMNASQKYFKKWRKIDPDGIIGLFERRLTPIKPNKAQSLMLELVESQNQKDYMLISKKLISLFQKELKTKA